MTFEADGAERFSGAVRPDQLRELESLFATQPQDRVGTRLYGVAALAPMLAPNGPIGSIAASHLGNECQPVRAIFFDKTPTTNWSLSWHQDRTVAVKERIDVAGFGPWTVKHRAIHVEPPFELLARLVTLRVHLDGIPASNAPLLIAPGSHKFGRIRINDVQRVVERCGSTACLADRGDIWLYSTPILHSSMAASEPFHRRVLQIDFAAERLPGGLQWMGV